MGRLSARRTSVDRASLQQTLGPRMPQLRVRPDRRNVAARNAVTRRILDAFVALPGTSLTEAQATRLFDMPGDRCLRILRGLADEGVLRLSRDGRYRLSLPPGGQRRG